MSSRLRGAVDGAAVRCAGRLDLPALVQQRPAEEVGHRVVGRKLRCAAEQVARLSEGGGVVVGGGVRVGEEEAQANEGRRGDVGWSSGGVGGEAIPRLGLGGPVQEVVEQGPEPVCGAGARRRGCGAPPVQGFRSLELRVPVGRGARSCEVRGGDSIPARHRRAVRSACGGQLPSKTPAVGAKRQLEYWCREQVATSAVRAL